MLDEASSCPALTLTEHQEAQDRHVSFRLLLWSSLWMAYARLVDQQAVLFAQLYEALLG